MTEKIPTSTIELPNTFKPDDLERLGEIKAIKDELLRSGRIPKEAGKIIEGLDIADMHRKLNEFMESERRKKEQITTDEDAVEVQIGSELTPIFKSRESKLIWDIEGDQFRESGQTMVELSFKRNDGIEIKPGGNIEGKVRFGEKDKYLPMSEFKSLKAEKDNYLKAIKDLSGEDQKAKEEAELYLKNLNEKYPNTEWVLRGLRHLNGLATEKGDDLLGRDPDFKETRHAVATLEKFTRLVNHQLERGQGIVILEGEAGTGKNKNVDHFAYLTRRPLFRFTCSAGKDEQDLKYLLEYDSKRGTYRINSTVIEALQTPGAILEFDEINTLKPEVAKMLNSLFDHDRALFLGEDKSVIKAAEGVILVGLQNPQHYMGVKPLAETIKSRARIMEVTYPPLEKEKKKPDDKIEYRSDEASMLREYVPVLKDLTEEEFEMIWDAVANNKPNPKVAELVTSEVKEAIEDIKEIVVVANKIRGAYRAYHEGKSDQPIKFVFSLRESVECAYEISVAKLTPEDKKNGVTKAKKAVQDVVLPKISLGEERTFLASLIAQL